MVDSKAVPGLAANQLATVAFKKLLKARLSVAVKRCRELDAHAESVHQLRVSTRRASAALRLTKESLPAKRRHRIQDLLRNLRRASGDLRDTDIFLEATLAAKGLNDFTRAFLTGNVAYSRAKNFANLQALTIETLPELAKLSAVLPATVTPTNDRFGDVLHRTVKRLMREFDEALVEAETDPQVAKLHQLRIQAKRLRYSLELLPTQKLAPVTVQVEKLQEILGLWHDTHTIRARLASAKFAAASVNGAAGSPVQRGIDAMSRQYKNVETRQLTAFKRWGKAWLAFRKRNSAKSLFQES